MLNKIPHVIIATPGRLWSIIKNKTTDKQGIIKKFDTFDENETTTFKNIETRLGFGSSPPSKNFVLKGFVGGGARSELPHFMLNTSCVVMVGCACSDADLTISALLLVAQ